MVRRIVLVIAVLPVLARAADLTPGTVEVTGGSSLGFSSGTTKMEGSPESVKTTAYGLDASAVYYLTPNVAVGLAVAYDKRETELSTTGPVVGSAKIGSSTLLIGPAIALELPLQGPLALAAQAQLGRLSATFTESGSPDTDASGWGLGVGAGLKYYVAPMFSVNAGLGYTYQKLTYTTPGFTDEPKITSSGLGLNVGLSVYFGR